MARKAPEPFEEMLAKSYVEWEDQIAPQLAGVTGPPLSADRFTDEEELDLWDWEDPKVNPETHGPQLWQEAASQGVPAEQQAEWVHAMYTNMKHPNRVPIMTTGIPDLEAQIKKANQMTRRSLNRKMRRLVDFEMPAEDEETPTNGTGRY